MKLLAVAAVALASGPISSIAAPAVNVDAPGTVRIYMAGSSSLRALVAGVVLNDICGSPAANSTTTLYNLAESAYGFTFSSNLWAISCRLPSASAALVGLPADTPVAFFKSDAGGSAQGVFPVYFGNQRPFVEPAALSQCKTITADRAYTDCLATHLARPQLGISDVEPGLFHEIRMPADPLDASDDVYPPYGLTEGQQNEMTIKPVVQTIFGLAVNANLYADMFAKQGLGLRKDFAGFACTVASNDEPCIPSIGYAEARSLLAGTEANWRALSANAAKLDTQVNICRYVSGSGAQAVADVHLMNACDRPGGMALANWEFSSSASPAAISAVRNQTIDGRAIAKYLIDNMGANGPMPQGTAFIFEGPGSGDVVACLNAAQKAGGYAIGHLSRENSPAGGSWKYLRLGGNYPSRDAAKSGLYDFVFESTVQWKKDYVAGLNVQQQRFITELAARMGKPDALAKLSSANQEGVAALPQSYAGAFGTGSANEITFGSRVNRPSNNCDPLVLIK